MQSAFSQKNLLFIIIFCLILLVTGLAIFISLQPIDHPLNQWKMTYNTESEVVTLPVNKAIQQGVSLMTLTTTFPAVSGDTLVLPRISGNAVEVILNDKTIYKLGDFDAPTANLWNSHLIVMLPEPLQAENQLKLRVASSIIGIGMSAVPYITNFSEASQRVILVDMIFNIVPMMTSGAALIIGLMLLISCYLRHQWNTAEYFIGIGLLFCVGYNYDIYFRASSGNLLQFLWVIKIIVVFGYLACLSLMCGLEVYIWNRLNISRWAAAAIFSAALVLLLAPDLYWFTLLNQAGTVLIFIIMTVFSLMVFKAPQKADWLHLIAVLIVIGLLQEIYELVFYSAAPVFLPYIISLSTIIIGVNLILEYNRLFNENSLLRHTNNLDPLTGALNRRILKEIDIHVYRFTVLIDLNGFKELNDQYGHMMGDEVIIKFASICRSNLRQDDLLIRWGGDEFLLAFAKIPQNSSGYKTVENIIQRIKTQFAAAYPDLNLSFSYGIRPVQSSFEQSVVEADRLMYAMKEVYKKEVTNKN
jgi:diguanylate cyclase (GGDEF)-like protein